MEVVDGNSGMWSPRHGGTCTSHANGDSGMCDSCISSKVVRVAQT